MKKIVFKILSLMLVIFLECSSVFGMMSPISSARIEVVKYMEAMAKISWTPKEDILYWNSRFGNVYKKNMNYKGVPYTQLERYTSLGRFTINLKEENGKKIYNGPCKDGQYLGTDCSWAVTLAWCEIVDPTFRLNDTHDMFVNLKNGIIGKDSGGIVPVGIYKIDGKEPSTKEIAENNGKEIMFKAYSQLKPADALLKNIYYQKADKFTGHIRLVKEVDIKNKTISIIEQTGVDDYGVLKGNGVSSWRDGFKISFEEFYNDGYIPVGNEKLISLEKEENIGTLKEKLPSLSNDC